MSSSPFNHRVGATSPLCELRPEALLENRTNTMKRVQFTTENLTLNRYEASSSVCCPVCKQNRSKFFCSGCIRNGDFTHSTVNVFERFAEKKLKFIALKGQQNQMEAELKRRQANIIERDNLQFKIRESENCVAFLQGTLKLKQQRIEEINNTLDDAKRKVLKCHDKQIKLRKGITEVKNIVAKQTMTLSTRANENQLIESDLNALIRSRVVALATVVFKIEQDDSVEISSSRDDKADEDEDTPLLLLSDPGTSTPIVKSLSTSTKFTRFRIGEPWLSSKESFANYFLHSARLEPLEHSDNNFRCDQYRMLSSLSYLCHLTNLIAISSNVILPKKILFSDFYGKNIHRDELYSLIAKLCANTVFLALFYHVDIDQIRPRDMFQNILHLLSNKSSVSLINRRVEVPSAFCKQLQDSLLEDLLLVQRDFLAFHDAHDEPEYDFVEHNIPDLNFSSPQNDQSAGTNILSMISSFYKRATK